MWKIFGTDKIIFSFTLGALLFKTPATECDRIIVLIHAFLNFSSSYLRFVRSFSKGCNFPQLFIKITNIFWHFFLDCVKKHWKKNSTNFLSIVPRNPLFEHAHTHTDLSSFTHVCRAQCCTKDGSTAFVVVHLLVFYFCLVRVPPPPLLLLRRVVKHIKKVIRSTVRSSLLAASTGRLECVLHSLSVSEIEWHCDLWLNNESKNNRAFVFWLLWISLVSDS